MLKQSKGEIWIGLVGLPFPMRADDIKEAKDGSVTFLRLVESKDGSSRKELIKTHKSQIVYISETLETAN
jgi:hypothetical protein